MLKRYTILKYIFLLFTLLFCNSPLLTGQELVRTSTGQAFLMYSDFTYELVDDKSQSNPFQQPKDSPQSNELSRKVISLKKLLNKEEILAKIETKRLKESNQESTAAQSIYSEISIDIMQLQNLDLTAKKDIKTFNTIYEKYIENDIPKTEINPYPIPSITGKTIKSKSDCVAKQWFDQGDKQMIKQSTITTLSTFTPDRLKNYYKQKPYLTINNQFETKGEKSFITFELIFRSKDIKKSYGHIDREDFLRLTFLNGKNIFLKPIKTSRGSIQPITGFTKYSVTCLIKEKYDLKLLQNKYIGEMGIMWSSGFEPYPIYNVSYFINKLKCFYGTE